MDEMGLSFRGSVWRAITAFRLASVVSATAVGLLVIGFLPAATDTTRAGAIQNSPRFIVYLPAVSHDSWYASCVVRREDDEGDDGSVDATTTTVFDDAGRALRVEEDQNGDGRADKVTIRLYDAVGRLLEIEEYGPSGNAQSRTLHYYSDGGWLVKRDFDYDADGTVDFRELYDYDSVGRLSREANDAGADGALENATYYVYDDFGRPVRIDFDDDYDGRIDGHIDNLWVEGLLVRVDGYFGEHLDFFSQLEYDADGRLVEERRYLTDPVRLHMRNVFQYNAAGLVALTEHYRFGELERREETTYDGLGRPQLVRRFQIIDGYVVHRYRYNCPQPSNA